MTSRNPQNRWRSALFAALCGAVAVVTMESPAKLHAQAPAGAGRGAAPPAEALFTSAQAVAGRASYQRNCASCHGANVDDGSAQATGFTALVPEIQNVDRAPAVWVFQLP